MKYTRPINTIGYLSITKKKDFYKNNPTKNNYHHNYMEYAYKNGDINNVVLNNNYNHLSKVLSQKKHKEEQEVNSYANQNMLINNDLDKRLAHISKKIKNLNKDMLKKNGSAKLFIEKVESQLPSINEEYYKFTNQRRPYDIKNNLFNDDQSIIDKKNYLIQDYQYQNEIHQSPLRYQNMVNNNSPNKKYKNSHSTKNIFKSNTSNHFYSKGKAYNNHNMNNKPGVKKETYFITKSPQYIRGLKENKYETYEPQYLFFENDSNKLYSFNPETSSIPNTINNMKFSYINKKDNLRYNIDINKDQKKLTLYENYKDLMKMNTFSGLKKKKANKNNTNYDFNINVQKIAESQPEINKKIIKIQSLWRGAYVRELMNFYWNLTEFKDLLNKVLVRKNFTYFKNLLKNYQEPGSKTSNNDRIILRKRCKLSNKENEEKTKEDDTRNLEEFKKLLNQRKEDYDDLSKKYNSLMEKYNALQYNNENKNLIWKDLIVEKYNFNVENALKNVDKKDSIINQKKFDIINPEQKEIFNIIQQKKFGKINPEQKEAFNIIQQKKLDEVSPKQNETFNNNQHKKFDIINPEQKEAFNIIQQKKLDDICPKQNDIDNDNQYKKFDTINPEQKESFNIIQQKKFGTINTEQKEAFNIIQQKKFNIINPEQKEAFNIIQHKKFNTINPEQKESFNIIQQKKFDTINTEQKDSFNIIQHKKFNTINPEQKEAFNIIQHKKFNTINPEQKEAFNIIQQKTKDSNDEINKIKQNNINNGHKSNLDMITVDQFIIESNKANESSFEIFNYELSLINDKKEY